MVQNIPYKDIMLERTNTELGKFFNIGRHTIGRYKKNSFRMYHALLMYYNHIHKDS